MITLNDGRQIEIIDIHSGQVDFRCINRQYAGIGVIYAAVNDPLPVAPLPVNFTNEDIKLRNKAIVEALSDAVNLAEPVVKSIMENAALTDNRTPSPKDQAIINSLPSWSQIDTAITNIGNLADAKAFMRKLSRVVYWLAKNSEV